MREFKKIESVFYWSWYGVVDPLIAMHHMQQDRYVKSLIFKCKKHHKYKEMIKSRVNSILKSSSSPKYPLYSHF